jgi:hypothetical protein
MSTDKLFGYLTMALNYATSNAAVVKREKARTPKEAIRRYLISTRSWRE